jgi:hypothetical protein
MGRGDGAEMKINIRKKFSQIYGRNEYKNLNKGISFDKIFPQYTNLNSVLSRLEQFKVNENSVLVFYYFKHDNIEETLINFKNPNSYEYSVVQEDKVIIKCKWNEDEKLIHFRKNETGLNEIEFYAQFNRQTINGLFDYFTTKRNDEYHSFNDQPSTFSKSQENDTKSASWHKDGELHRENGPASIRTYPDGNIESKQYWLNGRQITDATHEGFCFVKYDEEQRVVYKEWASKDKFYSEEFFKTHPYRVQVDYGSPAYDKVSCTFAVSQAHGYAQFSEFEAENPDMEPENGVFSRTEYMSIEDYENTFGEL